MTETYKIALAVVAAVVLGIAVAYTAAESLGFDMTLVGAAIVVFFGVVVGVGHSIVEGLVVSALFWGMGYVALPVFPELIPVIGGALAGGSLLLVGLAIRELRKDARMRRAGE